MRSYHSTLLDGMIHGYLANGLDKVYGNPVLYADRSFYDHLSAGARRAVEYRPIRVIDQDTRRWLAKSLLEVWVVLRCLIALRPGELLFVTTIMPSAMIVVEVISWLFRRDRIVVMQHGELDGAFQPEKQRMGSFGYYIFLWFRMRKFATGTRVAVLDQFIASELQRRFPGSVSAEKLHVVPLPMLPLVAPKSRDPGPVRCCFIGFRSPLKGYTAFENLAHLHPALEFREIGGGWDRKVDGSDQKQLSSGQDFLAAVARCDIAVMPYRGGYDCSLSAAATDAIAAGLHLLTSDRGCFRALAEAFGPSCVTVCASDEEMTQILGDDNWLTARLAERAERQSRINHSRYSLQSVGHHLERMIEGKGMPPISRPPLQALATREQAL